MLELRPYKAADALEIIACAPKQPGLEPSEQVKVWAEIKESTGPAVTGVFDNRVIGCGGLELRWPGFAEVWCLFVRDIGDYCMMPRTAKRILSQWMVDCKLVRVQAPLRADFSAGIRLAEWLGFTCEGRLKKYHPDGTDALMHSIIRED